MASVGKIISFLQQLDLLGRTWVLESDGCRFKKKHLNYYPVSPYNPLVAHQHAERHTSGKLWFVYFFFFFCACAEPDSPRRRGGRAVAWGVGAQSWTARARARLSGEDGISASREPCGPERAPALCSVSWGPQLFFFTLLF